MNPTAASSNVFAAAVQWLQALLFGSMGTAIAVIAVATVGFLLLTGRNDVRRAARVILGCFILFGAPAIAAGILSLFDGADAAGTEASSAPPAYPVVAAPAPQSPTAYDPYAGAALPQRR